MSWRSVTWGVGVALLVAACAALLQQVTVSNGAADTGCGSAFDVVAGRQGWRDWWALDVAETAPGTSSAFRRSRECPGALNGRMLVAGVLVLAAVAGVAGVEATRARHGAGVRSQPPPAADRFRRLGGIVTASGVLLAAVGAAALVLLVADPRSTLFLYVDRPVAVLFGLLLLQPAMAMVLVGRALSLAAPRVAEDDGDQD